MNTPKISVLVVFFNMRREARRTVHSLISSYQGLEEDDYEVILLESGSSLALESDLVASLPPNFSYQKITPKHPSPCEALNQGIQLARGQYVACSIDGARILSPGILRHTLSALTLWPNGFIYTLGMHLGPKSQNDSIREGYCQEVEDAMLESSSWEDNGYKLFHHAALAASSHGGYLQELNESNFFCVSKSTLKKIGGFEPRFRTRGGGLVNLDVFNRLVELPETQPILLLGEATFHQFHGGVATNVTMDNHPWEEFSQEYKSIRGHDFYTAKQTPILYGSVCAESRRVFRLAQARG